MYTWLIRAALAAAVVGAIYYGIDSVAGAFRERKQLRYDLDEQRAKTEDAATARDAALGTIERQSAAIKAELKARDDAAIEDAKRRSETDRKLKNAQRKLSEWEASAEPELARCLRLPLPRWLLDGTEEADPSVIPGVAAVLSREASGGAVDAGAGPGG